MRSQRGWIETLARRSSRWAGDGAHIGAGEEVEGADYIITISTATQRADEPLDRISPCTVDVQYKALYKVVSLSASISCIETSMMWARKYRECIG